jgi:hypothetical protein
MRFLGLGLADPVPNANTIWTFREALKRAGAVERLFAQFDATLRAAGFLAMGGQIVDATIVRARSSATPRRSGLRSRPGRSPRAGPRSRQAAPEGPRCALDGEVLQGQAARGWAPQVDLACRPSATRTTSRSIAGTG